MQRGKNDKNDSKRIAKYLYKNVGDLKSWQPKREVIQKLRALLVVRDRLIQAKAKFEVPIKENQEFVAASIRSLAAGCCKSAIAGIQKDLKKVNAAISDLIKSDSKLSQQIKIATSVTGIGPIIAANMVITTNEFDEITEAKKYACYSGVAPFEHSSGTSVKRKSRVSHLANKRMKSLLHLGARAAILASPELKLFYHRKLGEGKAPLSVLNAVCNKLISRVFVCIKQERLYEKNYQPSLA